WRGNDSGMAAAVRASSETRSLALAHSLGVAGREVGVVGVGADGRQDLPRTGAAFAFGQRRDHRDTRDLVEAEGIGGALPRTQGDRRGDADFREVLLADGGKERRVGDEDLRCRLKRGTDALVLALDFER